MTRWIMLGIVVAVVLGLPGCGHDDLGALLVRWPF